jgi:hypothetical protein
MPLKASWPVNAGVKSVGLLAASILFVLACYGPTVPLPYFWDDIPQYFSVAEADHLGIWTNQIGYGYYRPLAFSLYKLAFDALPFGATTLPHLAALIVHGVNGFLVGKLCRLIWQNHVSDPHALFIAEAAGTLLFVLFPFAALPVMLFASAVHLLVTLTALAGAVAAVRYLETRHPIWLTTAMLAALLGPYLHESGVMTGSVIALACVVCRRGMSRPHKAWLISLPFISASFLGVWLMVPKARAAGFFLGAWDEVLAKGMFFFQGLTYPLQPAATFLIYDQQWQDLGAIALVGTVSLALAALALSEQRRWRPILLSAGWLGLTMLPTVGALPFHYIITSPRLIYFPGVGGAILWSAVVTACITNRQRRWINWSAAVGALLLTAVVPFVYIQREVQIHVIGLAPLQQLSRIARDYPSARHLVVNTVNWMAYQRAWYPMGHDGVTVSADYIVPAQLVFVNSGVGLRGDFVTFGDLRSVPEGYYISTIGERESWNAEIFSEQVQPYDHVWLTTFSDSGPTTSWVGNVTPGRADGPPTPGYLANYEDKVYLLQADYEVRGKELFLDLDWWLADSSLNYDATVFRHVLDCAGNVLGIGSGRPLGGMLLLPALPAGARIHDVRRIPLEALPGDGCYLIEVGFFYSDGTRMAARAPDGSEYPNRLFLLQR